MAKNYHEEMSEAFHKAEKKVAGKASGGYDHHPETLKPKGASANGGGSSGEFTERGVPASVRKAEAKNRTSYGSKSVGAAINGGSEEC